MPKRPVKSPRKRPAAQPLSSMFQDAFSPDAGVGWRLGRLVAQCHPGQAVLDGVQGPFSLPELVAAGQCTAQLNPQVHAQMSTLWTRANGLVTGPVNAVYDVTWQGHALRVVVAEYRVGYDRQKHSLVVADTLDVARAFATAGNVFCNAPGNAVLRFSGGCWSRSPEMWEQVQAASFDDLVLAGDLKKNIQEDFSAFLAARAEYERYGIPHKRGVLFTGPPGNGKTHCLRAVMKFLGVPCLYVMSLRDKYSTEESLIDMVFERAREVAPCCLVFEDLDAMIHDKNRSYFLNQLDGLAGLSGVLTLATTNHPERLDPAIVDRPSRFDRKYHFALPAPHERQAYLALWNTRVDAALRVVPADVERLTDATDGFSFAYLKELWVSSMMRWVAHRTPGGMAAEMFGQVHALRSQMVTELARVPPPARPPREDEA